MKKYFLLSMAFLVATAGGLNIADAAANNKLQIRSSEQHQTKDIISGSLDNPAIEFNLKNKYNQGVIVNEVHVKADTSLDATTEVQDFVFGVFLNGIQQGSTHNLSANGTANFNDLTTTIPAGSNTDFQLVMNTEHTTFPGQIRLGITEVIAENQGTNLDVYAYHRNTKLGDLTDETIPLLDADCEVSRDVANVAAPKHVCGPLFNMYETGFVRASKVSASGGIILPSNDTTVLKIKLKAVKEDMIVRSFFLKNILGNGQVSAINEGTFSLKDGNGISIAQNPTISGENIYFELSNIQSIYIPKNQTEEIQISFEADTQAIDGSVIKLGLDINNDINDSDNFNGFEIVSSTTGIESDPVKNARFFDLAIPSGYGNIKGNVFTISN